jgi:hypothetical protein
MRAVLHYLVDKAARKLSGFAEPVVVAACPNKFDDAASFPDWLGVQVGPAMWERTDYRRESGKVSENSRNPDDLLAVRDLLRWLQEAEWRSVVELVFDLKLYSETLAIIKQHGAVWLVIAASNDGQDIVFLAGTSGELERVGAPARLDQRLGRLRPLILQRIEPDAWPKLHAAVPAFPVDELIREETLEIEDARARLGNLLHDAFSQLIKLPSSVHYVAVASDDVNGSLDDFKSRGPLFHSSWRMIAADGLRINKERFYPQEMYAKMIARGGDLAASLDSVLNTLESAKWRDLFARSIMPMARSDSLALLVRGSERWLIAAETAVFALTPEGRLVLAGACDRITYGDDAYNAAIHLFEGSTVRAAG